MIAVKCEICNKEAESLFNRKSQKEGQNKNMRRLSEARGAKTSNSKKLQLLLNGLLLMKVAV